jgi:hypothetical protein
MDRDSNPLRLITSAVFKTTPIIVRPRSLPGEFADCGCLREAAMPLRLFPAMARIRRSCDASKVVLG